MSLTAFNSIESAAKQKPTFDAGNPRDVAAARHAAMEFESMLLTQLTAALAPPADEDEENVFGGNTSNYYRQMFSEKMAHQLAEQGGVGLADAIMQKLGVNAAGQPVNRTPNASLAAMAARLVREAAPNAAVEPAGETAGGPAASPSLATDESAPARRPRLVPIKKDSAAAAPVPLAALTEADKDASRLHIPVKGRISSSFGTRRDPLRGNLRAHQGVDIAAQRGTPIAAAAAGKVVFAGKRGGYGNLVELEHADGRRTRYAHTDKILVQVGDRVELGETVATVGSTGRSTGPHLHFEVKEHGTRVDPLQAVAKDSAPARR